MKVVFSEVTGATLGTDLELFDVSILGERMDSSYEVGDGRDRTIL